MLDKNEFYKQNKTNFQFKLLSILQNGSQKGSTLAVGVALGALMIGGTVLAIATSSQNKTNVIADEQTAQALAAAEAGVARFQDFLSNPDYSRLAVINSEGWMDIISGQIPSSSNANIDIELDLVVSDMGILNTEDLPNNLFAFSINEVIIAQGNSNNNKNKSNDNNNDTGGSPTSGACTDFPTQIISESPGQITIPELTQEEVDELAPKLLDSEESGIELAEANDIGNSGATFRLINYEFDDGITSPGIVGRGILTVEGATDSSTARVKVEFDVISNAGSINVDNPVLPSNLESAGFWFQDFQVNGGGNQTINFDIVDSSGCTGGQAWVRPRSGAFTHNGEHIISNQLFPNLPGEFDESDKFVIPTNIPTITSSNCTLNSPGSSYQYAGGCGSLITVDISGGRTVSIYSNVAVPTVRVNGLNNNPGSVVVYSNAGLDFGSSAPLNNADQWKHIQYYVSDGTVRTNGNLTSSGFIFAPNSTFQINGGGNGTHTGPIWAKAYFTNGGGSSTLNPSLSRANFEYLELFKPQSVTFSISPPQGYERIEVSSN